MTRTSALALLFGLLLLFTWRRTPKKIFRSILIMSALTGLFAFVTYTYQQEIAVERYSEPTDAGRFNIWRVASEMINDHPFLGCGSGAGARCIRI
jgi:O-antigen ligase